MNAISSEEDDEGKRLFFALLNWHKLVYKVFGQSTIYTQFLPKTARKELIVPKLKISYGLNLYTVT